MLTFNVVLGYQGLLFRDFLWFCFLGFFFQSDRPTQYQETYSMLNETLNLLSNAIAIGLELTAPNLELGDPYKVRNFLFLGATIFDHLTGEGVWIIWFGLEFLDNYGKLFT